MRKGLIVVLIGVLIFGTVSLASAQLINPARRAKRAGQTPPPPPAPVTPTVTKPQPPVKPVVATKPQPPVTKPVVPPEMPTVTPTATVPSTETSATIPTKPQLPVTTPDALQGPAWATASQPVQNDIQGKSDINGDGKLQSFETKIYLRDMIDQVQAQDSIDADTDILKAYDQNGDGKINVTEIAKVMEDVGR